MNQHVAGVELGGTKSIAVLALGDRIINQVTVPTTTPEETLPALRAHLARWHADSAFSAIGIASFGPLQLNEGQAGFGALLKTPKPNWSGANIAAQLTSGFFCPWKIDTDVNGAALAEHLWGAGTGCNCICYVTIGTGVGGGLVVNGQPLHGAMHPEIGHIRVRRSPGDTFAGACPFHADCIEGLVSGPALAARFGAPTDTVPDTHPTWLHVADDIAELSATILLTTSAQRILFGGGVSTSRPFLLPLVQQRVVAHVGSYLPFVTAASIGEIIRPPTLGSEAGPRGGIALALAALGD